MPNDFSGDSNCVALWRFEDGALTVDSKGGNTLGNMGGKANTSNYREGGCSVHIDTEESDRLYVADGDLDLGFPFKGGDEVKNFSFCFWAYLDSLPGSGNQRLCLIKTETLKNSFRVFFRNDGAKTCVCFSMSTDGSAWNYYHHASGIEAGKWYHVGVTYELDGGNGNYRIRVSDDDAVLGVDKTGAAGEIFVSGDSWIWISYANASYNFDGDLDEFVIFKDILTVDEIDQISAGNYGGAAPSSKVLDYERKTRGVARGVVRGAA